MTRPSQAGEEKAEKLAERMAEEVNRHSDWPAALDLYAQALVDAEEALGSVDAFVQDIEAAWPGSEVDNETGNAVGGLFATMPIARAALSALRALIAGGGE